MKRLSLILVLILVAASIVTAQDIKVGGVGPVTGEAATFGVSTKNGIMLAAEEWNAKGGYSTTERFESSLKTIRAIPPKAPPSIPS